MKKIFYDILERMVPIMDENYYKRIIAINLKRLAYEHNKSQAQISRDLGINKQTLSTWMNGERIPRMKNIDVLCEYFNCKRTDILEPYLPKPLESFTAFERNIILAYRNAPDAMQDAVLVLLGMKK